MSKKQLPDGAPPKGPSTKERLNSIVSGFDGFDTEMKIGTRQRREKDEFKITELKTEMQRLDVDLTAEIKRRTEMNKSTQMWFEQNLTQLSTKFHASLEDRSTKTHTRLDELNDRITNLDERFEKEKEEILRTIEERGRELAALLNQFRDAFERDRELRLIREAQIVKQLTDHEHEVSERFESQISTRESRYLAIKNVLEDNIKLRDKAAERFQTFFEREVHQLHNEVTKEIMLREREDDEIVEALNRYTLKLQTSLKVLNSTEM